MNRYRILLAIPVLVFGLAIFDSNNADAGRFGLFRGRLIKSTPTYRTQTTNRTYSTSRTQATRANGPRITGRHDWPGAIGAPDPRYLYFQDINGYWK